jgi:hypothetical protein
MPIELVWLIPDTILLSRWSGHITKRDVLFLVDELGIILDAAPRIVHSIVDLSDAGRIGDEAAYAYFRSRIPTHPRRGRVALVRAAFQGVALADIFNRVSNRELFRLFDTREEARDFLLHHDTVPPALPSAPPASPLAADTSLPESTDPGG